MNLKAKRYEESHLQKGQSDLTARVALLKERGLEPKAMEKDPIVRKLKADLRKYKHRMIGVATQEKLLEKKAQHKQEKAAAKLLPKESPKAEAKKEAAKPAKKEKKAKEKKAAPAAE
jgi:hypothetical protein